MTIQALNRAYDIFPKPAIGFGDNTAISGKVNSDSSRPTFESPSSNKPSQKSDSLELSSDYKALKEENDSQKTTGELTPEEEDVVKEMQARDREVRAHEQAHVSAGGGLVVSGPTYFYQRGPDGRNYAIGGEVQIDNAPVAGDPEATIRKMQQVIRAALAPAEPSSQDQAVASAARAEISRATIEKLTTQETAA